MVIIIIVNDKVIASAKTTLVFFFQRNTFGISLMIRIYHSFPNFTASNNELIVFVYDPSETGFQVMHVVQGLKIELHPLYNRLPFVHSQARVREHLLHLSICKTTLNSELLRVLPGSIIVLNIIKV